MRAVSSVLLGAVTADVYFHAPRGSNNKLNEQSNNVNNDNRLFDSQNNAAGGYQVGDACERGCLNGNNYDPNRPGSGAGQMRYYAGTVLPLEWTSQHGCGAANSAVSCEFVIQYMCGDDLRDGSSRTTIPDDEAAFQDQQYGKHESYASYQKCKTRQRNKGLFVADQSMSGRETALYTRQDNAATRYGFECNEERDYYPYWHPTEWRDVAVLTDNTARCGFYRSHSQNSAEKGECSDPTQNNVADCVDADADWERTPPWVEDAAPECLATPYSRDNHLGNVQSMDGRVGTAGYNWTLPSHLAGETCVLRIRYNISTSDFDGWRGLMQDGPTAEAMDASFNAEQSPVKNDPTANFLGFNSDDDVTFAVRLNVDSSQYGRTFEDRTHTFRVEAPPTSKKIHNLNVRGRRGNIVQVYPSVEYDFVPNYLEVEEGDYVHFQWTGSDANSGGNAGNGRSGTDRSNLVETKAGANKPTDFEYDIYGDDAPSSVSMFAKVEDQKRMAYLEQSQCDEETQDDNDPDNCKQLNQAAGYFDGGLVKMDRVGSFSFISTRNNDFSNRAQKGTMVVRKRKKRTEDEWTVAAMAGLATAGLVVVACLLFYAVGRRELLSRPQGRFAVTWLGKGVARVECYRAMSIHERIDDAGEKSRLGRLLMWWLFGSQSFCWMVGYFVVNAVIFLYGFVYNGRGDHPPFFPYAKGAGAMLNLNCSLILVPMCRNMITFLRSTSVARLAPLDDSIAAHKLIAKVIGVATVVHVACHYADYAWLARKKNKEMGAMMWSSFPCVSGHVILFLMALMGITASERVRRRKFKLGKRFAMNSGQSRVVGGREIFALVHWCWVPALGLLLLHGPVFWIWLMWPLILYATDTYIRRARGKLDVLVSRAILTSNEVVEVRMRLASGKRFNYKAGQYLFHCAHAPIAPTRRLRRLRAHCAHCAHARTSQPCFLRYLFIQVPEISKTEWHPFTISSSPETRDFFSCHIRCRPGMDWVNALKKRLMPNGETDVDFEAETFDDERLSIASYDYRPAKDEEEAGRTPVAIMVRESPSTGRKKLSRTDGGNAYNEDVETGEMDWVLSHDKEDDGFGGLFGGNRNPVVHVDGPYGTASEHVFDFKVLLLVGAGIGVTPFASIVRTIAIQHKLATLDTPILKVYFYWICRDESEFDSFQSLLSSLSQDVELRSIFELHTYITGEFDLSNAAAKLKPEMNQYTGRPNWTRIFKGVSATHSTERIGVFFCGPNAIGAQLEENSGKFTQINSHGEGTQFVFHKETF